jgi:cobyrinic acid a,c-diamide synthase
LDLKDLDKIEQISQEVLEHIDLTKLRRVYLLTDHDNELPNKRTTTGGFPYPFPTIKPIDERLAIVTDQNFSFLYHDNLEFLKEQFREVVLVDSTNDESIPSDCDRVYICGGYVESDEAYNRIKSSDTFRNSLIDHAKTKPIYAECAGLLYLGKSVDSKEMSGILDIRFTLERRFNRLGYYYNEAGIKGHSFHYTKPTDETIEKGFDVLTKRANSKGVVGSWSKDKVFGTYLHTMFRNNIDLILN